LQLLFIIGIGLPTPDRSVTNRLTSSSAYGIWSSARLISL